ncbi:hypothetical protein RUM44_012109 [Polyplax serrata]|uniref:Ubiquitin-like protease family profile domain-containing protein n=1 Tax=Polyplax serrata TaxID=468196 RepID=A0ABR1BES8_POLSC
MLVKESDSDTQLYGKRMRLNSVDCVIEDICPNYPRLPMQARENVISGKVENSAGANGIDDDDDACCVIAEIPRRKKLGSTLSYNVSSEKNTQLEKKSLRCTQTKRDELLSHDESEKDIDIIKCVTGTSNRSATVNESKPKFKFFTTQRNSLSQSKAAKSKLLLRNQLKRNLNFFQECYRFKEKQQYIELLKSQTSCNLLRQEKRKLMLPSTEAVPLIDLTVENDSTVKDAPRKSSSRLVLDSNDTEEIQIVKEIPRVTSFEDVFKSRPINTKQLVLRGKGKEPHFSERKNGLLGLDGLQCRAVNYLDSDKKTCQESLEVQLRTLMQITESKHKEADDRLEQYFLPELSEEQEMKIQKAIEREPRQEVLVEGFGIRITRRDMQTLRGLNWLNDEVINFYMNLIMSRNMKDKSLPKVYAFNTFFYTKLFTNGYQSLRRWTKQVDIFSHDMILVPIHLGMHWCMSVIDFRSKFIKYYDSVGAPNDVCLDQLLLYLKSESLDKKEKEFNTDGWTKANVEDTPQQMNGSDCGVFSCMFAEHLARDAQISFTQDNMPYFRRKMILEILEKKLLT